MRCGGELILTSEALFHFPNKLPEFLAENAVTHIYWVPTVMINIANSGALEGVELPALKTVAFAGEVMPNRQLNVWRAPCPGGSSRTSTARRRRTSARPMWSTGNSPTPSPCP